MDTSTEAQPKQELQVTDAASWSKPRMAGLVVELPSGKVARLRRSLDLMAMLKTGQIANPLAGIVQEMIRNQSPQFPTDKMDEQTLMQMMDLVDTTAVQSFIEPKVEKVPEGTHPDDHIPSEGHVSLADIDLRDRFFVFGFVQGGTTDLRPFRGEPDEAVDTAQDVGGVQQPTE